MDATCRRKCITAQENGLAHDLAFLLLLPVGLSLRSMVDCDVSLRMPNSGYCCFHSGFSLRQPVHHVVVCSSKLHQDMIRLVVNPTSRDLSVHPNFIYSSHHIHVVCIRGARLWGNCSLLGFLPIMLNVTAVCHRCMRAEKRWPRNCDRPKKESTCPRLESRHCPSHSQHSTPY